LPHMGQGWESGRRQASRLPGFGTVRAEVRQAAGAVGVAMIGQKKGGHGSWGVTR
jgi:hypothetical protein